ncbi:hypothetical protein VTK73DRAFT_2203 [Phialemonium thermophilum]|uniref:Folylpolyglutamate synthase n=1 Tax=Phialemonium thermophilum TaxID=223376 RepID=A0ABR3Y2J2_9PEZI
MGDNRQSWRQSNRSYEHALELLSQVQSNKAVTNLFDGSETKERNLSTTDLNALAIPEMEAWLHRAGYTPANLSAVPCVHVAGTKGKGSVSALTAAILTHWYRSRPPQSQQTPPSGATGVTVSRMQEGSKGPRPLVGTYSSPHVVSVRERIALDGEPIDRERFAFYFFEVWDRLTEAALRADAETLRQPPLSLEEAAGPATKPFFFRLLTLVAFHTFLCEGVRAAVIECGIGGEYDATNVLPASAVTAAVITQLGIDHIAMLGSTIEEIAWHKAGIFKTGVRAFTRRLPSPEGDVVMEVLRRRAAEKGAAELVEIADEDVEAWSGVHGAQLRGPFQKWNMALAAAAAREHILRVGGRFDDEFAGEDYKLRSMPREFEDGLREASLKGRSEVFIDQGADGVSIRWYLDGAHTEDSVAGVGQWFASEASSPDVRRVLVFNQQDRDTAPLLQALVGSVRGSLQSQRAFHCAIFTRNDEKRPAVDDVPRNCAAQMKALEAMKTLDNETQSYCETSVESSIDLVRTLARKAKQEEHSLAVLVTGSFHLVGPVIRSIEHVEC